MKKHMLRIALAVAVVLGVGSIATGSVILASLGAPDQAPATEAGNVDTMHPVSSETPDRPIGAGNEKAAMAGGPDTVLTMADSDSDSDSDFAPLVESGGTSPIAAASAGSAGVVGASGSSAASAGAASVPSATGRNVQQAAMAMPLATMPRPSPDSSARAGGSSAGPTETGTSGPAASPLPEVSATPETSAGTTPTDIAKAVLPELTGGIPDTLLHNYGPNDLPAIPPSLDLNEPTVGPVIAAGAKDPAASPENTVAEPSTLALFGMAALGLVVRRRRRA